MDCEKLQARAVLFIIIFRDMYTSSVLISNIDMWKIVKKERRKNKVILRVPLFQIAYEGDFSMLMYCDLSKSWFSNQYLRLYGMQNYPDFDGIRNTNLLQKWKSSKFMSQIALHLSLFIFWLSISILHLSMYLLQFPPFRANTTF